MTTTRVTVPVEPAEAGAQETLRVLLDNLVIAQSLSKELRQRATDEARAYLYALRAQPPSREDAQPVALPTESAPRDGTMLRLRVRYEADNQDEAWTPLEDSEESWTIGFNNFDNTGVDRWQFVGWDWSQDYLLEATGGTVIGWLPFHTHPAPDALRVAVEAFMPSAEVAFLWAKEAPPADEVRRYRERYWAVKEALAALQAEQKGKP